MRLTACTLNNPKNIYKMEKMSNRDWILSKVYSEIKDRLDKHEHCNVDFKSLLDLRLTDKQIDKGYFVVPPEDISLFINMRSKKDLDRFLKGKNESVKTFLETKKVLICFCYSENLGLIKWVLGHKNVTLYIIRQICRSNKREFSKLGKEALKKFINSLDKIKDLKWEKIVKEDYEKTILHLCQIGFAAEFGSQPGNYIKDSKGNYSKRVGGCF